MTMAAQRVLDFWFLPVGAAGHGAARNAWFRKDAQFDAGIRAEFGGLIEQALAGDLPEWDATPSGMLARILLLDQFTRNAYRDTPRAFAGDAQALAAAQVLLASGGDRTLTPLQRMFAYLPFEHAEDIAMQEQSVALFHALVTETDSFASNVDYAIRHRDIVAQFGRFPHRNRILGRASTPEELAFLTLPGSGF